MVVKNEKKISKEMDKKINRNCRIVLFPIDATVNIPNGIPKGLFGIAFGYTLEKYTKPFGKNIPNYYTKKKPNNYTKQRIPNNIPNNVFIPNNVSKVTKFRSLRY